MGKQVDAGFKQPRWHGVIHRVLVGGVIHQPADGVSCDGLETGKPVCRRNITEHRWRCALSSRPDVGDSLVEVVGESPGSAAGVASWPLPSPSLIACHSDAGSRLESTFDFQKRPRLERCANKVDLTMTMEELTRTARFVLCIIYKCVTVMVSLYRDPRQVC
jgi:hypothetical protein